MRLSLVLLLQVICACTKSVTPHFKWGQTKEQLFISVMVRDLAPDSVSLQVSDDGDFSFTAAGKGGEQHVLEFPFREDVSKETLSWEILARPDKWGVVTLITLGKAHGHRWDLLTSDVKKYKGLIDKDWTREDQSLEPADEKTTFDDAENVVVLDDKTFNKTVSKHPITVVAVRFPWCTDCKVADQTFLKAANLAKARGRKKQTQDWKKVSFAYVDARSNKKLGKRLGAACSYTCEFIVFNGAADEAPVKLKFRYEEIALLDDVAKFLRPAVLEVKSAAEINKFKAANATVVGFFKSQDEKEYRTFKSVANLMRGELVFVAQLGERRDHVELWALGSPQKALTLPLTEFQANHSILEMWLRRRSLQPLQEYDWQMRDTYEKVELPIARLYYDDKSGDSELNGKVSAAVEAVAKKMLGKIAFVRQKSSTYSFELKDFGLAEEYPCFGIAENASYGSRKFGFEVPSVSQDFWSDPAAVESKLLAFCEGVLAGTVEESHESGPIHANWTKGEVKRVVWKSFQEDLKRPETDVLLVIFGKYRNGHESKSNEVENLARVLEPYAAKLTVASYDTAENYLPPEFHRDRFASYSEWYWISASGDAPKKLPKPKKDPPMKKVIQFLVSQAPSLGITAEDLQRQWEEALKENPPPKPLDVGGPEGEMPELEIPEGFGEDVDEKPEL